MGDRFFFACIRDSSFKLSPNASAPVCMCVFCVSPRCSEEEEEERKRKQTSLRDPRRLRHGYIHV